MCCTDIDFRSAYISKIVTIEVGVGTKKHTFYAHHDLLTFYSGYFRAALDGGFAEAQSGVIKLDVEEPTIFQDFVMWLYTNKARADESDDMLKKNCATHYLSCVRLWIFADRRDIPLLMNEMVDELQKTLARTWQYPDNVIKEVYENTVDDSLLRCMVVDSYKCTADENVLSCDSEYFPSQFLIALVRSLATAPRSAKMSSEEYEQVDLCPSFHVHEGGVRCTRPKQGSTASKVHRNKRQRSA